MKNIAILTLPGNFNYGNRLQNYALEQVIQKKYGSVETIIVDNRSGLIRLLSWIKLKKYELSRKDVMKQKKAKKEKFSNFTKKYLHNTKQKQYSQYEYVIVGSDQVWNPSYMKKTDGLKWFLDFVPKEKRISYAASFGVSDIPENSKKLFEEGLKGMSQISVREQVGVKIVNDLAGKVATLVVDPTMLLTHEDWETLIESQSSSVVPINEKFVLVYMLRSYSEERQNAVIKFAKENNFKIIQIMGDSYNDRHFVYDPIEFIEGIKNAQMVFTDSFHCAVFSIIFNTPFCVFDRTDGNMGSRLQTLLDRFNLLENQYHGDNTDLQKLFEDTDFSNVEKVLEIGRKEGMAFLSNALK